MDVPDVYVHPPEEEQCDTPTWCYFNSADPHAPDSADTSEESDAALVGVGGSQSNDSVDLALAELRYKLETEQAYYPSAQDAPVFHRDVIEHDEIVMPRRSSVYYQTRPEFGLEMLAETSFEYRADEEEQEARAEERREEEREGERRERSRAREEDVDIAEVVKVRRRDVVEPSPEEEAQTVMKRSKTLKGRATLALRTIKNAGKRTRKTSMKENANAQKSADAQQVVKETTAGEVEDEQTPKLSRRKSRPISLFFPFSNSEPSVPQPSSVEPTHLPASYSSNPPPRPPRSPIRRTVSHAATLQTASTLTSPSLESDSSSRGNSPYLLDGVQSAPRRRFSFANLQSLFTSSTSPSSSVTDLAGPTDGSLPSSAEPETPTDDGFIIPNIYTKPAPMIESLDSADIQEARRVSSQSRPSMQSMLSMGSMGSGRLPIASMMERKESYGREPETVVDVNVNTDADEGFEPEMRLDSLHFESLRFDPETFDVEAYLRSDA